MLSGSQRKYLRGLAHNLKPVVLVGQRGLTESLVDSVLQALDDHELIKIKFNEYKDKEDKKRLIEELETRTGAELAGLVGHVAILYKAHPQEDRKKIILPGSKAS